MFYCDLLNLLSNNLIFEKASFFKFFFLFSQIKKRDLQIINELAILPDFIRRRARELLIINVVRKLDRILSLILEYLKDEITLVEY